MMRSPILETELCGYIFTLFSLFLFSVFYLGFKVACQNGVEMLENKHYLHEKKHSFFEYFSDIVFLLSKQLPSCIKIYHQYLTDGVLHLLCLSFCLFQAEAVLFLHRKQYQVNKGLIYTTSSLCLLHFICNSENFCAVLCKYTHYCTKLILQPFQHSL